MEKRIKMGTETEKCKQIAGWLCYLSALFLTMITMDGVAQSLQDGPYVFYKQDTCLVRGVLHGKAIDYLLPKDDKYYLYVNSSNNLDGLFSFKMKDTLRVEPCEFSMPEQLFVVSDIEGEFAGFRSLLMANGVIDSQFNWKFGKGHLVICGDLFDRGMQVTEELWLLYKLETEAKNFGGYVHVILGNHDIMNLSGDLRYVQPKYFEAAKLLGVDYMDLYAKNTELGRWLRTKNIVEKIGNVLFMHAGLSPQVSAMNYTLQQINDLCRPYYDSKKSLVPVPMKVMFGDVSPFWYRGYFMDPKISAKDLAETLKAFQVDCIVVGHTIVPENVGFSYNRMVLGLDVDQHAHVHQAALYQKGIWFKVDDQGKQKKL